MIDPLTLTARAIADAVNAQRLHPRAVVEAYLDRIARVEPGLKSFIHLDTKAALAAADRARPGPLAGVPFGIKDVFDTGNMPTSYGSDVYPGFQPARDASAVHLAHRAGGVALGKTVTTEFATAAPGATVNPFDASRTPGGSSSGSAAGLGAGLFPLAFGTQTSGSTVRPSSYCGVVGYKASRGLIDRTGVKPLSESLDVVGVMARDVLDCALLASVVARRPDLMPGPGGLRMPRIGLFAHDLSDAPSGDAIAVLERAAGLLGRVSPVAMPDWWLSLGAAQADVFAWEASASLSPERDLHWDLLQPRTHEFLGRHDGITFARWIAGLAARDAALADLDRLYGDCDVLITQPAPGEAPVGHSATGPAAYNIRWTLLGTPSLTIPAGLGPAGLPIGIQVVARPGDDARLLAWAAAIEQRLRAGGIAARPGQPDIEHAAL